MEHQNFAICRMCLERTTTCRSLFEDSGKPNDLLSIARDIVRLHISVDDIFTKMICSSCITKLETIEGYVKLFQESDRKLRGTMIQALAVVDDPPKSEQSDQNSVCEDLQDAPVAQAQISNETRSDPIEKKGENTDIPLMHGSKTSADLKKVSPVRRSLRVRKKYESSPGSTMAHGHSVEDFEHADDDEDRTSQPEIEPNELVYTESKKVNIPRKDSSEKQRKQKQAKKTRVQTKSEKLGSAPMLHDFKCYICSSEPLGSRKALIEHLATHVDKIPYTCEKCVMETAILTRVRTLNTHMKMHEQPVKCDYCDRRYSNAAGKYYHTQTFHLGGGAPCLVNCDICGKQCGSKMALKQHMKYHTTSLKCSKCDMVFNHANKRRNHELTHDEQRGYECIVCRKVLQTIESYDVHLKKHSQERSYQCSLCPKKFNTSFNLILHLKVHAKNYNYRPARSWTEHYTILSRNPMQYKCNHCDRYGTDKVNNMISHLQAHFKEYQCDRCNRPFATAKQLRAHYTTYTGEKSEMCQHCGKCFSTKNSLRIHLKTHARAESLAIPKTENSERSVPVE